VLPASVLDVDNSLPSVTKGTGGTKFVRDWHILVHHIKKLCYELLICAACTVADADSCSVVSDG